MAIPPGNGARNANSVAMEICGHIVEPVVNAVLDSPVMSTGLQSVNVSSTEAMYSGANIIVSNADGTNAVVIAISAVGTGTMTADFPLTYPVGSLLLGATFPTQQATDPLFTQTEVLGYIARAQNVFLAKVPCIFDFFENFGLTIGQMYYDLPETAIELERVSIQVPYGAIGYGEGGYGDGGFDPMNQSTEVGFGEGGFGDGGFDGPIGVYSRLYEVTQNELSMRDPQWFFNNYGVYPRSWFEDRTGVYRWGIAGIPQANLTAQLMCSVRDTETLTLTDHFLVPDMMLHGVKYLALSWMWDKAGEQRSPSMSRLAKKRFDSIVIATDRYVRSMMDFTGGPGGGQ